MQNKYNVYACGDTHGHIDIRKVHLWAEKTDLHKDKDILIVLGDWGELMYSQSNPKYKKQLKRLRQWAKKPFTTFIQLGNHENYNLIEQLPTIEKFGGKVYALDVLDFHKEKVIDTIYIMQRGEIYTINDKTFFSFGGALSQDKITRNIGLDYWIQELPTKEEENHALDNLERCNFKVDFVITHTCPSFVGHALKRSVHVYNRKTMLESLKFDAKERDGLAKFLEALLVFYNLDFKEWHFGHWHFDRTVMDNFFAHYNEPPRLILRREKNV